MGFEMDGKNLLCRRTCISFRISWVKEAVKRNGWLKFLCVSTVSSPWSYVQAELCKLFTYSILFSYSVHCRHSVAKALHVPISLWRYLVLATLAPGRISKPCYARCVSLCWRFQVWGLWLWRARQQSFLGGLWVLTPLSGFTQLLSALALQLWSHCPKLWEHKHPLPAYTIFCGDVAVQIHGKQCS